MELWLKPFFIRDGHGCFLRLGKWEGATLTWSTQDSDNTLAFSTPQEAEAYIAAIPFPCNEPRVESRYQ